MLTAGTANITGFHYVGNVDVPIAGGTESMMKFTADSVDLSGTVTVTVTQNGVTVTTVSATQDFSAASRSTRRNSPGRCRLPLGCRGSR